MRIRMRPPEYEFFAIRHFHLPLMTDRAENTLRPDPHEAGFESIDRDTQIRTILGVDQHFQYEILGNEDWIGRR